MVLVLFVASVIGYNLLVIACDLMRLARLLCIRYAYKLGCANGMAEKEKELKRSEESTQSPQEDSATEEKKLIDSP